jgi:hypothetical protein
VSDRSGTLSVCEIRTVYSALLNQLLGHRRRADNALAVKLQLGFSAACNPQSAENVVILADFRNAALFVARSRRSWIVRDIDTSVSVVAVCNTLVE